ncbi:MAG TPA: fatty acid desaturase [Rhodanobacteraceae bacterium]|nr:fatty acid desaturase [Rhodanobacteraceae bacterium]
MIASLLDFARHGLSGAGWLGIALYMLVATQLTIFAVTLYLHRSQTHRGVDFHPVVAHFFRFWSWLSTGMVTREWVAIHRKHHAFTETADDPHSPQVLGIRKVFWQGVELYRTASEDQAMLTKYGRGTPDDWLERHVYGAHPYFGPALLLVINLALFGTLGVAMWGVQMLWIPFWAAGVVNGLGHWWGYRNFETSDKATNLTPWGIWIGGEELHNNHHAFPSSAKFALRHFEVDIGWIAIRGLARLRLAKVLRVAPDLDVRPDVSLPDSETLKAVLTHRFQVMTDFSRRVIHPTLRAEAEHSSGGRLQAIMPRRLRGALANGGRWLDTEARARMRSLVDRRPTLRTVCDFRARLAALMEQRGADAALKGLQQWVREAEQSGIRALQDFARQLKGYRVAHA